MNSTLNILVIEDSEADFLLLMRFFRKREVEIFAKRVETASEMQAALSNQNWSAILADMRLPAFSVEEALAIYKADGRDIPFIIMSGVAPEEHAVALFKGGAHDFVSKNNLNRLLPAIEREIRESAVREKKREAEQALRASEERFHNIFMYSPIGMFTIELKTDTLLQTNYVFRRMIGYSGEELCGMPVFKLIHPEDEDTPPQQLMPVQPGGRHYGWHEKRYLSKTGETIWVQLWMTAARDAKGEPEYCIVIAQDITERKEIDKKLRQAAKVFENTTEGVMITDMHGKILAVNHAFTHITGYLEAEVLGKNPRFLKSNRHDDQFYQTMWLALRQEGKWQGEIWNRRKNGEIYPGWLNISITHDDNGAYANYVGVFSDISDLKHSEERLYQLAYHDALTSLPNRLFFSDRLQHTIFRAKLGKKRIAILFLDLDRFKTINDSLGHSIGDNLLRQVSRILKRTVRESDVVTRLGGDEFVILLEDISKAKDVSKVAQKLLFNLSTPFELTAGQQTFVTASIGISLYPMDGEDVETLMKNADTALYRVKAQGRNNFQFYSQEMTAQTVARFGLERELREALKNKEFILYYQPQISLRTGRIVGLEVLIRWMHPQRGLLEPQKFLPLAEEVGLFKPLDEWVLYAACRQAKFWSQQKSPIRIAVNLFAAHILHEPEHVRVIVQQTLEQTNLDPNMLELEITENIFIAQHEPILVTLNLLKELGVHLAMDDFGTGYSSLSYLRRFPIDRLKIDRSFVKDLEEDENTRAIVRAVIALGHSLKLTLIAEGVETEAQREILTQEGCHEFQGFLYSKPVPAEQITTLLQPETHRRLHYGGSNA